MFTMHKVFLTMHAQAFIMNYLLFLNANISKILNLIMLKVPFIGFTNVVSYHRH